MIHKNQNIEDYLPENALQHPYDQNHIEQQYIYLQLEHKILSEAAWYLSLLPNLI